MVPTWDRAAGDVPGQVVGNMKLLCKAAAAPENRISALLKPGLEHVRVANETPSSPQLLAPTAVLKHIYPSGLPVQPYNSPKSFCLY